MENYSAFKIIYSNLLKLYPKDFYNQLGESMEQTFEDLYLEQAKSNHSATAFIVKIFTETFISIIKENFRINHMSNIKTNPLLSALIGFLFVVPFFAINLLVISKTTWFYKLAVETLHINNLTGFGLGFYLFAFLMLLFPVGAFIALRPVFQKDIKTNKKLFIINIVLAFLIMFVFISITSSIGQEIYRCDFQKIPNCD